MKLFSAPTTKLGKTSFSLIIAFLLFLGAFYLFVASGETGGETFFSNTLLTIPFLLAAASGIAAFFAGLVAVFKEKERSVLVYLSIILGLLVLVFITGELVAPH